MTSGYHLGIVQFDSLGLSVFDSRFMKFVLGRRGGVIFVILDENFDTG